MRDPEGVAAQSVEEVAGDRLARRERDRVHQPGQAVLIGLSERTNEEGARQLAVWLYGRGIESRTVDIRTIPGILHLKSGIAFLGEGRLAVVKALAGRPEFSGFEEVRVPAREEYAANCLRVNGTFIVPAGYPGFSSILRTLGLPVVELDMSEFRKMDGGLSCLSLRF